LAEFALEILDLRLVVVQVLLQLFVLLLQLLRV